MRVMTRYAGIITALFLTGFSLLAFRRGLRNEFRLYGVLAMLVLFVGIASA